MFRVVSLVVVLIFYFESVAGEDGQPRAFSNDDIDTLTQPPLRGKNAVKESGWFETDHYEHMSSEGTCEDPVIKKVYTLNGCGKSASNTSQYLNFQVDADPSTQIYTKYKNYYTTPDCSGNMVSQSVTTEGFGCMASTGNEYLYADVIAKPFEPAVDDDPPGVIYAYYDNGPDCQAGQSSFSDVGLLEADYKRFNYCYDDLMFVSCNSTMLVFQWFPDAYGNCTGSVGYVYNRPSDTCRGGTNKGYLYAGYWTYLCNV